MLYRQISFSTSWKRLLGQRDWFRPLLKIALLAWIPILGEIVVFGYGYERARLIAWGVDASSDRHGTDYRTLLHTGVRAFLVSFSMRAVLLCLPVLFFGLDLMRVPLPFFPLEAGSYRIYLLLDGGDDLLYPLLLVMLLLAGTFISVAAMRATIYDQFSAGWRIDRLLQMVARDLTGFFRTYGVALMSSALSFASIVLTGFIARIATRYLVYALSIVRYAQEQDMLSSLLITYFVPLLLLVVITLAFAYGLALLASIMQLVSISAMGQWFSGFEVDRWDVSSAPLPPAVIASGPGAPEPPRAPAAEATSPSASPAAPADTDRQPDPVPEPEPRVRQIPLAPMLGEASGNASESEPAHRV
ncbi:DUF4013 domain-containing protein [Coriobacterium glomerans]|nr:DUF4013 domain-containing protein [Coriobacterium glomerans]